MHNHSPTGTTNDDRIYRRSIRCGSDSDKVSVSFSLSNGRKRGKWPDMAPCCLYRGNVGTLGCTNVCSCGTCYMFYLIGIFYIIIVICWKYIVSHHVPIIASQLMGSLLGKMVNNKSGVMTLPASKMVQWPYTTHLPDQSPKVLSPFIWPTYLAINIMHQCNKKTVENPLKIPYQPRCCFF